MLHYFLVFFSIQCIRKSKVDNFLDNDTIPINTRINFFNFKKKSKKKDKNILDIENEEFLNKKNIKNFSQEKSLSCLKKIEKNNIKVSSDILNLLKQKSVHAIINYSISDLEEKNYIEQKRKKYTKESIIKIKNKNDFIDFLLAIESNNEIQYTDEFGDNKNMFDKPSKKVLQKYGEVMKNNSYTEFNKVYDKETSSFVGFMAWATRSTKGPYELLQKAIDLGLIDINAKFETTSPKLNDDTPKQNHSLIVDYLYYGFYNPIETDDNFISVLQKLLNNNEFSLKDEQVERIETIIYSKDYEIDCTYSHFIGCLKTFSKYLSDDRYSKEMTDYKNVELTDDEIEKLKISHLFYKNKSIKKNKIDFNKTLESLLDEFSEKNKALSDKDGYQLRLKFIKYLLKHKLLNVDNLFPETFYNLIHCNPQFTTSLPYVNFRIAVIEILCKSRYCNNKLKKVFYSKVVESMKKNHIDKVKDAHRKIKGICTLLNTKIDNNDKKLEL